MTSIRDYEEQQFLNDLREAITDEALRERIENLYDRDHTSIQRKEKELHETYKRIPATLKVTSELTGLGVNDLITIVGRTSAFMSLSWYEVLDIIRSYHIQLKQLRKEQEKAE